MPLQTSTAARLIIIKADLEVKSLGPRAVTPLHGAVNQKKVKNHWPRGFKGPMKAKMRERASARIKISSK